MAAVELAGHAQQGARTDFQSLQAAPTFQPNIILLDIGLPDVDGWELARELRSVSGLADSKIIAVTGYQTAEDRRKSQVAGIDFHLGEPACRQEISGVLSQAAGGAKECQP